MQIIFKIGTFRASGDHDPVVMRRHGWIWIPPFKEWRTSDLTRVAPFVDFCVGEAERRVRPFVEMRRAAIAASVSATADIHIPVGKKAAAAGKDFYGYQRAGVQFSRARPKSLNGDTRRLGKMIQAIGLINTYEPGRIKRVLAISPANAKITWCDRWEEWGTHPELAVDYCEGSHNPESPFLVINWDVVARHESYLRSVPWDVVIGDEVHRLGNPTSQRTIATLGPDCKSAIPASLHWLMLSGNPIGTRPVNLWPMLQFLDPQGLGANYWRFVARYCDADKWNGWDASGASNMEELQYKMRAAFMVRRDKHDVAEELPPLRETVKLPKEGLTQLIRAELSAVQAQLADFERLVKVETKEAAAVVEKALGFTEKEAPDTDDTIAYSRQQLTLAALPMMINWIHELRETEEKIIIFAHHRRIVQELHKAFPGSAFVIGGMSATHREAERVRFQEDPNCHEFVGNIAACCENLELSAADTVVFCELTWQPWQLDQAEDRVWLVTKTTPIQIYRLVVDGSASAAMADLLELRQDSIERATVARRLAI